MSETETVFADIRVTFERTYYYDDLGKFSEVRIKGVESVSSDLTEEEAGELPASIMESSNSSDILNALIDSLAGNETKL